MIINVKRALIMVSSNVPRVLNSSPFIVPTFTSFRTTLSLSLSLYLFFLFLLLAQCRDSRVLSRHEKLFHNYQSRNFVSEFCTKTKGPMEALKYNGIYNRYIVPLLCLLWILQLVGIYKLKIVHCSN